MPIRKIAVFLFLVAVPLMHVQAQALPWPTAPTLKAKSWLLLDAKSGQVLAQHEADVQLAPASLTKMMTLYLAFEDIAMGRLTLNETVQVSKKAWRLGGSRMFLEPRMHPSVKQILHGISTMSGNDACIALAEHVAGTEESFVERMNQKAKTLGMTHSHFMNSTGFPTPGHYSSAHDMALLGAALWRDFPKKYELFSQKSYTFNHITQSNRNRMLWTDPRVDGIKTGHTKQAGYCLVTSGKSGDTRLVSAVFGTKSDRARARQSRLLLNYGFRNFSTLQPAEGDIRRKIAVFQGKANTLWLVPAHPVMISVPKGYIKHIRFHLHYAAPLIAPVEKGQHIGTIEAVFQKKNQKDIVLTKIPMIARDDVKQASWFGRQWDVLKLWWQDSHDQEDAGTSTP